MAASTRRTAWAAILALLPACEARSVTTSGNTPSPADLPPSSETSPDPTPPSETLDGGARDPNDQPGTNNPLEPTSEWVGSIDSTSWSPFGPDECRYAAHYEKVAITLTLGADKTIVSATVSATATEKLIGCTYTPAPKLLEPKDQTWTYSTPSPATAKIVAPGGDGDPKADLTVEVDPATSGSATLTWKRVNVAAPWNWTVGPQYILLTKK